MGSERTDTLLRGAEWVLRLLWLTVLWVTGCLMGGIVFGVGPATTAMVSVDMMWLDGKDLPTAKVYFIAYRGRFWASNATMGVLLLILSVLGGDLMIVHHLTGWMPQVLRWVLTALLFVFGLVVVWVFPLLAAASGRSLPMIVTALKMAGSFPFRSGALVVVGILVGLTLRGVVPVAGIGAMSYLWVWALGGRHWTSGGYAA